MIRWITDCIGTAAFSSIGPASELEIVDVRDLVDGKGNTPQVIREKIDLVLAALNRKRRVIVCCDYGISRSNSIAAGAIALHENCSFDDALQKVISATRELDIRPDTANGVRLALAPQNQKNSRKNSIVLVGGGLASQAIGYALEKESDVVLYHQISDLALSGPIQLDLLVRKNAASCIIVADEPNFPGRNRSLAESVMMLKSVLDACRENEASLIYLSSWEVYGGYQANPLTCSPGTPPRALSVMGIAHAINEQLIEDARKQTGLKATIIRPARICSDGGIGQKFLVNFIGKLRRGENVSVRKFRNGYAVLDLIHVKDLAHAVKAALHLPFGEYNVGGGDPVSTVDLLSTLSLSLRSSSQIRPLPIEDAVATVVMDNSSFKKESSWSPIQDLMSALAADDTRLSSSIEGQNDVSE
jgi:nucleoside-diphosphate-sugar epimerase